MISLSRNFLTSWYRLCKFSRNFHFFTFSTYQSHMKSFTFMISDLMIIYEDYEKVSERERERERKREIKKKNQLTYFTHAHSILPT